MGISKILLAEVDMEYGEAFARAVSNLQKEFEITLTNISPSDCVRFLITTMGLDYDLVLVGGCTLEMIESFQKIYPGSGRIAFLIDWAAEDFMIQSGKEERQFWYISKYRNIHDIISDLNFLISSITGRKSLFRNQSATEFIGFFSSAGGCGKSVVAMGTSRELSRYRDSRVLYLSFEEIPTTSLFFRNRSCSRNLADYLYYLFEKKDEALCSTLGGFTITDSFGVESFYPSNGRNDLNDLSLDELVSLFKLFSDSNRYGYIVLDLKNDLSEETLFLLNLCSKIMFVQDDSPVSSFKNRKCIEFLYGLDALKYENRLVIVQNRSAGFHEDAMEMRDPSEESGNVGYKNLKRILIEKDEESFRCTDESIDVDISHSFGIGIKMLTDEILSSGSKGKNKGSMVQQAEMIMQKGDWKCTGNCAQ